MESWRKSKHQNDLQNPKQSKSKAVEEIIHRTQNIIEENHLICGCSIPFSTKTMVEQTIFSFDSEKSSLSYFFSPTIQMLLLLPIATKLLHTCRLGTFNFGNSWQHSKNPHRSWEKTKHHLRTNISTQTTRTNSFDETMLGHR